MEDWEQGVLAAVREFAQSHPVVTFIVLLALFVIGGVLVTSKRD